MKPAGTSTFWGLFLIATLLNGPSQARAQLSLSLVTNIPCNADGVAISNHLLYVGGADGLRIFDIAKPGSPVDVGYNNDFGRCDLVEVSGAYVYAIQNGLRIFDNSNPTNPVAIGLIAGSWADLSLEATNVYLSGGNAPFGVSIYDISNPTSPVSLGQIQTSGGWPTPVAVNGGYAYLADSWTGLLVYNISNLTNPVPVTVRTDRPPFWNVMVSGDYAFTSTDTNSLSIYNVSNPANPVSIFRGWPNTCFSMVSYGNYLLATTKFGWATAWDVSNPTNALLLSWLNIPSGFGQSFHTIAVSQNYAYTASGPYLTVLSLGEPAAPLLGIAVTSTNTLILSWPTPATGFSIQQNSGLNSDGWRTLMNQPVVVGSRNEVVMPTPSSNTFYRLVSQ